MVDTTVPTRRAAVSASAVEYVTEILQREAESAQQPAPPRQRWRLPILLILLTAAVLLTVWNVTSSVRTPEVFSAEQENAAARFYIYLLAQDIEAYRDSAGVFPPALDVLGQEEDGIIYALDGEGYTLTAIIEGESVDYRSGESLEPFASAYDALTGRE